MKISNQVRAILQNNTDARNSDRELLLAYMESQGMNLTPKQQEIFRHMPSSETISRVRRKYQEQGYFPATKRVKTERNFRSYRAQQNMPITQPDKIEAILEPKKTFVQKAIPWLHGED